MLEIKTVTNGPIAICRQCRCHGTLDFVSVPGFPSAIRVFASRTPAVLFSTIAVAYLFLIRRQPKAESK